MKFIALALALSSLSSFAATVHSAKLDALNENVLVDISYGGGCKKHTFSITLSGCQETYPVSCQAKLIEKIEGGFDPCEALVGETVKINLRKNNLDDSYFSNGTLTILGDLNMNGKPSSATVKLP